MRRPFLLVIGPHRGGTSATAGCLSTAFGVHFGGCLMGASPENPKGYFEDLEAVGLHDWLLREAGLDWKRAERVVPGRVPWGDGVLGAQKVLGRLKRGPAHLPLGLKDPRATFFAGLWAQACDHEGLDLRVLRVRRSLDDVAASLSARDGFERGTAFGIATRYDREAESLIERLRLAGRPCAEIRFPVDLGSPAAWANVEGDLGMAFPFHNYRDAGAFFDPALVHHGS